MPKTPPVADTAPPPALNPFAGLPEILIGNGDPRLPARLGLADGQHRAYLLPDGRALVADLPPSTLAAFYPDCVPPPAEPSDLPPPPTIAEV